MAYLLASSAWRCRAATAHEKGRQVPCAWDDRVERVAFPWCCEPVSQLDPGYRPGTTDRCSHVGSTHGRFCYSQVPRSVSRSGEAMDVVHPRCSGLDVHKKTVVACVIVPGAKGKPQKTIRTFGTMTDDLLALGDWLAERELLIRYADDAVLLCRTEAQAREALWRVGVILTRLKLTLHPTKTQVVYLGDGRQGFDFLGFHRRKVESWKYRGRRYLQSWPGRRAMQRIRQRIKALTAARHTLPEPVGPIVAEVNQMVRGWGAYFRVGKLIAQVPSSG